MFGVLDSQVKLQSLAYPKVWVLYMLHVSVSEGLLACIRACQKGHWKCMLHIQDFGVGFLDTCVASILLQIHLLFSTL
jgi:hypothetical protein